MSQLDAIRKAFLEQLEAMAAAGVTHLPRLDMAAFSPPTAADNPGSQINAVRGSTSTKADVFGSRNEPMAPVNRSNFPLGNARPSDEPAFLSADNFAGGGEYGSPIPAADRSSALAVIRDEIAQCTKCVELARLRKHTVPGVGNPNARLCFVGEAPGAEEDLRGEPFVGAAGQLLDKIIEAIKLKRDDVFILNTIKCRPPGNRVPNDAELGNCWQFAVRQLEIIQPEFICCLGSVAAKTLLQTNKSIGQLRGEIHNYRGSRVLVTYHPAYLLRTPSAKRLVWDDMKILMREMGLG